MRVEILLWLAWACFTWSLPAWGVRVEILGRLADHEVHVSLPAWGVRVEIDYPIFDEAYRETSLPAWGVRAEMSRVCTELPQVPVTPRMGSAG